MVAYMYSSCTAAAGSKALHAAPPAAVSQHHGPVAGALCEMGLQQVQLAAAVTTHCTLHN
jgi:hypothetical protein